MTCGVETMILLLRQSSFLFAGDISPVKIAISVSGMVKNFWRNCVCCSTNGFVGARNKILLLFFFNSSAMTISAIIVFPRPAGNTTSVLPVEAVDAMFSWYARDSTLSGFMYSFFIYTKKDNELSVLVHLDVSEIRFKEWKAIRTLVVWWSY